MTELERNALTDPKKGWVRVQWSENTLRRLYAIAETPRWGVRLEGWATHAGWSLFLMFGQWERLLIYGNGPSVDGNCLSADLAAKDMIASVRALSDATTKMSTPEEGPKQP